LYYIVYDMTVTFSIWELRRCGGWREKRHH
jgi:hypothetical protein